MLLSVAMERGNAKLCPQTAPLAVIPAPTFTSFSGWPTSASMVSPRLYWWNHIVIFFSSIKIPPSTPCQRKGSFASTKTPPSPVLTAESSASPTLTLDVRMGRPAPPAAPANSWQSMTAMPALESKSGSGRCRAWSLTHQIRCKSFLSTGATTSAPAWWFPPLRSLVIPATWPTSISNWSTPAFPLRTPPTTEAQGGPEEESKLKNVHF